MNFIIPNGINATTGEYLLKLTPEQISKIAQGEPWDRDNPSPHLSSLLKRHSDDTNDHFAPKFGIDSKDLSKTGWGIIFAKNADPAIREALSELIEHRRNQAGQYFKEFIGETSYLPGDNAGDFLAEFGATVFEPADPKKVPYYLLIVGDPETIPYSFQYQLDVQYAVGRIYFKTLEEYAQYAHSVVQAETQQLSLPRRARFFGTRNSDDPATQLSADTLIKPLSEIVSQDKPEWDIQTDLAEQATKSRLEELIGGADTPALLFTASHGLGFKKGDPRQLAHQGAFLCQEWPGPREWSSQQPFPEDFYFSADDLGSNAKLWGLIGFHFACFGAGTPKVDDFGHQIKKWDDIAPHAFTARLPQRMLSHPNGGALAVIGHIDRAWGCSFIWERAGQQLAAFESVLKQLMEGYPVGAALEFFNQRYAALSSELTWDIDRIRRGRTPNVLDLSNKWTANNDARGYGIVGDPAVRLMVSAESSVSDDRPQLGTITFRVPESHLVDSVNSEVSPSKTLQPIRNNDEHITLASFVSLIENLIKRVEQLENQVAQLQSQLAVLSKQNR
ncbi:hypothetical protein H1Q63_03475 [Desmonostoc muscorum CCALA 125]|nr:hypothetical protein [Desmonostoc muscorum CCALA 125]